MIHRRQFLKSFSKAASGLWVAPSIVRAQNFDFRDLPFLSSGGGVCTPGQTFANTWAAQVVTNGGSMPSANTINAIATLQCGLIAASLDTQMIFWNLLVPDSLIAAATPQKPGDDGNVFWNLMNFTGGDLSLAGLKGDGATKFINPGSTINSGVRSAQNIGLFFYTSQTASSTNGRSMGALGGAILLVASHDNTNQSFGASGANPTNVITTASGGAGFYSDQRVSSSDHRLYYGNTGSGLAQLGSTDTNSYVGGLPSSGPYMFCINSGGSTLLFSAETGSACGATLGLNLSQVQTLFSLFNTARISLGGGSV